MENKCSKVKVEKEEQLVTSFRSKEGMTVKLDLSFHSRYKIKRWIQNKEMRKDKISKKKSEAAIEKSN